MRYGRIEDAIDHSFAMLRADGEEVDTGHWQGITTGGRPDMVTRELLDLVFTAPVPDHIESLRACIEPNLPWADDHFEERVSRDPSNPGEQYKHWPWWHGQTAQTMSGMEAHSPGADSVQGVFSHTYQERFWPKYAQRREDSDRVKPREGIRYRYGDLDSVVNLLVAHPHTRQATFPIFFPEDTGAAHGGRIPCTLHYHFMLRNEKLHMWYAIRSCDAVRHFRDDIYLACRLLLWVIDECTSLADSLYAGDTVGLNPWARVEPGELHFTAYSFHYHKGDEHHVRVR